VKTFFSGAVLIICLAQFSIAQVDQRWKPNDETRPNPPDIESGTASTQETPGKAPSDAVVLFDGKDLSRWLGQDNQPAKWKVADGYFEVVPKTGVIHTRQPFGDCQLHVEFSEPTPPHGESQERGNSGIFLHGQYEVQVLDSYQNKTYADGQVSAIYAQFPPLVNPARPPGQWQTYDIIFHGPRFDKNGKVLRRARFTVLLNGVLTQDNVELSGPTGHHVRPPYKPGPAKQPLALQDHGNPVRYRNIWIRELKHGR